MGTLCLQLISSKRLFFTRNNVKMNKLILICLMGLCAVMAAPTQDEQEVADMMNAGLKLMAKEGRLGELSDDMEIQMLDLKQVCSTACAVGGQALQHAHRMAESPVQRSKSYGTISLRYALRFDQLESYLARTSHTNVVNICIYLEGVFVL